MIGYAIDGKGRFAMMTRILKHEAEELLAEGKKLLESGEDSKFAYRVTMVNLLLEDSEMTTARLSELSGVPTRTLNDWVKKADESGFEALRGTFTAVPHCFYIEIYPIFMESDALFDKKSALKPAHFMILNRLSGFPRSHTGVPARPACSNAHRDSGREG